MREDEIDEADDDRSGRLVDAVSATRRALDAAGAVAPADVAALLLAEAYAREIDGARAAARRAEKVLERLDPLEQPELYAEIDALRKALSHRMALDRIGDRLHRMLVDLHAVPKGRPAAAASPSGAGKLGRLAVLRGGQADDASA